MVNNSLYTVNKSKRFINDNVILLLKTLIINNDDHIYCSFELYIINEHLRAQSSAQVHENPTCAMLMWYKPHFSLSFLS